MILHKEEILHDPAHRTQYKPNIMRYHSHIEHVIQEDAVFSKRYSICRERSRQNSQFLGFMNEWVCLLTGQIQCHFSKILIFYRVQWDKRVRILLSPTTPPPYFLSPFLKTLSPTLPKLMNWILLSPPPLSSDPATPPKFGTCTVLLTVEVNQRLKRKCVNRRSELEVHADISE